LKNNILSIYNQPRLSRGKNMDFKNYSWRKSIIKLHTHTICFWTYNTDKR